MGDEAQEVLPVNGFGGKVVAATGQALFAIERGGVRRECDDGSLKAAAAQFTGRGIAIEHRHLHIHEDEVEVHEALLCRGDLLQRLRAVFGERDNDAGSLQDSCNQPLVVRPIFDQQHLTALQIGLGDGSRLG